MVQVLYTNPEDLFQPARHVLVIGQPRSGKTSCLLKFTYAYWKLGETVVARDIGEFFEFLNLVEEAKMPATGFVSQGCRIRYSHPLFEQREFDLHDMTTLLDQLRGDRMNLIMFEGFSDELRNHVWFWQEFIKKLLPWKRRPENAAKRLCLVMDEFGDIAPGQGRYFIPEQSRITQLIGVNLRKFRRHHIRLVAAVHYFRDISPPIRERFDCYFIKKNYPNPKEVPLVLMPYSGKFAKLQLNEAIFVDSAHNFNQVKINELEVDGKAVKPKRYDGVEKPTIIVEGEVDDQVDAIERSRQRGGASEEEWRDKAIRLQREVLARNLMLADDIVELWKDHMEWRQKALALMHEVLRLGAMTSFDIAGLWGISSGRVRVLAGEWRHRPFREGGQLIL
jgi:hypothetical protein